MLRALRRQLRQSRLLKVPTLLWSIPIVRFSWTLGLPVATAVDCEHTTGFDCTFEEMFLLLTAQSCTDELCDSVPGPPELFSRRRTGQRVSS